MVVGGALTSLDRRAVSGALSSSSRAAGEARLGRCSSAAVARPSRFHSGLIGSASAARRRCGRTGRRCRRRNGGHRACRTPGPRPRPCRRRRPAGRGQPDPQDRVGVLTLAGDLGGAELERDAGHRSGGRGRGGRFDAPPSWRSSRRSSRSRPPTGPHRPWRSDGRRSPRRRRCRSIRGRLGRRRSAAWSWPPITPCSFSRRSVRALKSLGILSP